VITEQDLQAAIAECQGERNPNANTCIKLASFLTIREHMFPQKGEELRLLPETRGYSYAPEPEEPPVEPVIDYQSDTEFGRLVYGKKARDILPVIDELVSEAVMVTNPRLYHAFLRRLK
jgi:hypothetical protein